MLDVMQQAKNAIETYNTALRVTSANIANMSNPGYKRLDVSFQAIFERVLSTGTSAFSSSNVGGTNPIQYGQGVAVSGVGVDYSPGDLSSGSNLDAAIDGQGLFVVSPDGGQTYLYTRAGQFTIDSSGNLLTKSGLQVYGFYGDSTALVPISGLDVENNIIYRYSFKENGELWQYNDDDWTSEKSYTGYTLALVNFQNPTGLQQAQGTTFTETLGSGAPSDPMAPGDTAGTIKPRYLEQANVFYTGETIYATEIQRAMSGNLNMLRMANDLISNFISKLG